MAEFRAEIIKQGWRGSRRGWNGSGQWVLFDEGFVRSFGDEEAKPKQLGAMIDDMPMRPHFILRCADGMFAPWAPSTTDAAADDWYYFTPNNEVLDLEKEAETLGKTVSEESKEAQSPEAH